jgi:multidrug efflux system membrane fusion protein
MGRKGWVVAAVVVVALAGVTWAVRHRSASSPGAGAAGKAPEAAGRAIPVTVAPAVRRNVPIYLEGLGSVLAIQTVTVRTQVDGRVESVLFREGQAVRKGQALAQIDPRPFQAQLHQAEGALARDEAQLQNARVNVARDRQLVAQNLVAPQQLDADSATVGQLEGAVQMDRAAIETARLNLEYARISSPIDGVTGIRLVDPGNVVHPSDQNGIVVVAQLDPVAVLFSLPQDQLGPVSEQLARGPLQVEIFSRDAVTLLGTGRLEVIDNSINATTSTVRLKAILPNPRRALWPNQFVNARLRLEVRKGALVVPAIAVQRGPSGTFVYVVGPDGMAALRTVAIDTTQGDQALVASGVAEGDRVVVEGQNQLRPGARVAPREAGAAPAGARVASDGAQPGPTARDGGVR